MSHPQRDAILNLRHRPPRPGFAAEEINRLLDDKRQARIGFALIGASMVTGAGIIGWIVLALM